MICVLVYLIIELAFELGLESSTLQTHFLHSHLNDLKQTYFVCE